MERLKSLYKHFGFELVGKAKVPNSNVNHYGLLRNKKKSRLKIMIQIHVLGILNKC